MSIAFSSWGVARGSALQLLLNVAVLIVVGATGLTTQRRIWHGRATRPPNRNGQRAPQVKCGRLTGGSPPLTKVPGMAGRIAEVCR